MRSSDPTLRMRALRGIASVGLRPWSAMLLQRTREVGDGAEADELVWLIGACQWEPADDPAIVQLRLWAAGRNGPPGTTNGVAPAKPEPRLHLASAPVIPDPEPEPAPRLPVIHAVAPPEAPPAPPLDVPSLDVPSLEVPPPDAPLVDVAPPAAPLFAAAPVGVAPVRVAPVETPPADGAPVAAPPREVLPTIVEEIEAIVGARVLALNFVPLAQSGS